MRVSFQVPICTPKIALVGEAPGEQEELIGKPFQGQSGQELTRMLHQAGIVRADCFVTNVFMTRPPNNNLLSWCVSKKDAGKDYPYPPLAPGKYLPISIASPERERLYKELHECGANLVVALGNTACWALLAQAAITKNRGRVFKSPHIQQKVLPTYHPAAILRQWSLRAVCVADLMKARRESEFKEVHLPRLDVWIEPTLSDVREFKEKYLDHAETISVDIETAGGQITCIGFAPSADIALVVPLVDRRKPWYCYWTREDEEKVLLLLKEILSGPARKVFQNGMYDVQYLTKMSLTPRNWTADTMVLHHSLQPELPKSLDFLASMYTSFPTWKFLRPRGQKDKEKVE